MRVALNELLSVILITVALTMLAVSVVLVGKPPVTLSLVSAGCSLTALIMFYAGKEE